MSPLHPAVVREDGRAYYIQGLEEWPQDVDHKWIQVTGVLTRQVNEIPPEYRLPWGASSKAGIFGTIYYLEHARYLSRGRDALPLPRVEAPLVSENMDPRPYIGQEVVIEGTVNFDTKAGLRNLRLQSGFRINLISS